MSLEVLADLGAELPVVLIRPWDDRPFTPEMGDLFLGEERVILLCFGGLGIAFFWVLLSPFESLVGLGLAFLPLAVLGVFPGRRVFDLVGLCDGRPRFGVFGVAFS